MAKAVRLRFSLCGLYTVRYGDTYSLPCSCCRRKSTTARPLSSAVELVPVPSHFISEVFHGICGLYHYQDFLPGPTVAVQAGASRDPEDCLTQAVERTTAFQTRCARRWRYQQESRHVKRQVCFASSGSSAIPSLADVSVSNSNGDDEGYYEPLTEHSGTVAPSFAEKQQARAHALGLQWVSLAASRVTRHVFHKWQKRITEVLLPLSSPAIVASVSRCDESCNAALQLSKGVRQRGAKHYIELLAQHNANPLSMQEWRRLCSVLTTTHPVTLTTAGGTLRVLSLPLLPSGVGEMSGVTKRPHGAMALLYNTTSWRETRAIISWARIFEIGENGTSAHISSKDLDYALYRYLQSLGGREEDASNQRNDSDAVVEELLTLSEAAHAAEHANIQLASASGVDRTARSTIKTEVKNIDLPVPSGDTDDNSHLLMNDSYNELLLQGHWRSVVEHVLQRAQEWSISLPHKAPVPRESPLQRFWADMGTTPASCHEGGHSREQQLCALFNPPRLVQQKRKILVSNRAGVRLRGNKSSPTSFPRRLAVAPMTEGEMQMIVRPPTHGLVPLRISHDLSAGKRGVWKGKRRAITADAVRLMAEEEVQQGRKATSPPSFVIDLRRRLWILAQLPPHLPRSLIRFEGNARTEASSKSSHLLPYLWRCPAKETLPWLLVAAVAAAAERVIQGNEEFFRTEAADYFSTVRQSTLNTMFTPLRSYAAFHEFCADLLVQLGGISAELACTPVAQGQVACSNDEQPSAQIVDSLYVKAVKSFLQPPTFLEFYDCNPELLGSVKCEHEPFTPVVPERVPRWPHEPWCRQCWRTLVEEAAEVVTRNAASAVPQEAAGDSSVVVALSHCAAHALRRLFLSPSPAAVSSNQVVVSEETHAFLKDKVSSLRNYHTSIYLETCAKIDTLPGLLASLASEVEAHGPPVLAPETAAMLTTALVMHLVPSSVTAAPEELQRISQVAHDAFGGRLYFVAPADKMHPASSYFKAVYDPTFIREVTTLKDGDTGTWTCPRDWEGAEALLVGRSLRFLSRYPTTTTEAFFKMASNGASTPVPMVQFSKPPLRLKVMCVDIPLAIKCFFAKGQLVNPSVAPYIVAKDLSYGLIAVYKPTGMNCTLHAGYASLIPFLKSHLPWRGWKGGEYSTSLPGSAPVLHQHGLVNRIDVGTSGLVLVTDNSTALQDARRAMIVNSRVRKVYRALVQYCPPPLNRLAAETPWHLSSSGSVHSSVFADGTHSDALLTWRLPRHSANEPAETHSTALFCGGRNRTPVSMLDQRSAVTHYRVLEYFPYAAVYYVEVQLGSGRRHQIRQHFAQLWHPLLGDDRYHPEAGGSGERWGLKRLALHAFAVHITGPGDAQDGAGTTVVECGVPVDMQRVLQCLREGETCREVRRVANRRQVTPTTILTEDFSSPSLT